MIEPSMLEDKPFSKKNHIAVFLEYLGYEHAVYALDTIYAQHYPITHCFLLVHVDSDPSQMERLQILFPNIKIQYRPKLEFLEAVQSLSKLIDSQFVAAFDSVKFVNKWAISEALNKILRCEDWYAKLNEDGLSFVALRIAFEKASPQSLHLLEGR